jgi:nucleotide-binding universal stress UspA family protein
MPTPNGFPTSTRFMAPVPSRFSVILGLDFTDADGPAFDQAARLVTRVPGSELHVVHVFDTAPSAERSRQLVGQIRLYIRDKGTLANGIAVGIHLRGGKTVHEILQLATEVQADVIVVGSHKGPHIKDWIVGSTVERLVSGASFAVLVASPKPKTPEEPEPVIEPPCPQCLRARTASRGEQWWCERHAHAAKLAHTYSYRRELPMATHDSEVVPTGVDS